MNDTRAEGLDETVRRRFESDWLKGTPRPIEDLLPDHQDPRRLATLEALVQLELEFAWRRFAARDQDREGICEPASVESYLKRFPQLNATDVVRRLKDREAFVRRRYAAAQPDTGRSVPGAAPSSQIEGVSSAAESPHVADLGSLDRYQLLEECGRGGFGVVWRARDPKFGRDVALKELTAFRGSQAQQSRFVKEATIQACLEHPGVVPVYDLGDLSGERPFYTMKLVQGRTLAEAIRGFHEGPRGQRTRSVEQLQLLQAFLSVTRTMEFAHSRGVLHRDLKPQNIILGGYGEIVILDWGLAKDQASHDGTPLDHTEIAVAAATPVATLPGTVQGTPAYMSPEQAMGKVHDVDQRSDIYALGVILFELLTGRLPFDADTSKSMLMLVVEAEPARPRALDAEIPPTLEAICLKAMQKSPAARYRNVRELREDVERFLADAPVSAHRETMVQRLARSARRHKSLVLGTAAVVTVAALAAGLLAAVQTVKNRQLNTLNAQLEALNQLERDARESVSKLADINKNLAVQAQRQTAQAYQRQGQRLLKDGESVAGLHSLVRSLEVAPPGSEEIRRVGLRNLSAWSDQLLAVSAQRKMSRFVVEDLFFEDAPLILMLAPFEGTQPPASESATGALSVLDYLEGRSLLQPIHGTDLSLLGAGIQPTGIWFDFHFDPTTQMLQTVESEGPRIHGSDILQNPQSVDRELRELTSAIEVTEFHEIIRGALRVRQLSLTTGRVENRQLRIPGFFVAQSVPKERRMQNLRTDITGRTYLYCDYVSRKISLWSLIEGGQLGQAIPGIDGDLSDDGRTMAVLQTPTTVQLYSVANQQPVGMPLEHTANVSRLELSPDGSLLAVVLDKKSVHVWDTKNPKLSTKLDCQLASVDHVDFRKQNDALILAGSHEGVELWLLQRSQTSLVGLKVRELEAGSFVDEQPAWTSEGSCCIVGFSTSRSGVRSCRIEAWRPSVDPEYVVVAALAGEDSVGRAEYHEKSGVMVCNRSDGGFQVMKGGAELPLPFGEAIGDFSLSPDGDRLAVIDQLGVVRVWDLSTRRLLGKTLEVPPGRERHLFGFRSLNHAIMTAESQSLEQTADTDLVVWTLPEERIDSVPVSLGRPRPLAVPDTDVVAFAHDDVSGMACSDDGTTLAVVSSDGELYLRSRITGKLLAEPLTITEEKRARPGMWTLMFGPDSKTLLSVRYATTTFEAAGTQHFPFLAQLWDLTTRRPTGVPVTVDRDNEALAWNAKGQILVVGVSPDPDDFDVRSAVHGSDVSFRMWDLKTGKPIGAPLVHRDEVTSAVFSPDGRVLATGSVDRTARLWNAATGIPLCDPLPHYEAVRHVFFVSQGAALLTVADDGSWRTWSVKTGEPLLPRISSPHRDEIVAAVSTDGRRLVTGGAPGAIQEWDVATGLSVGPPRGVDGDVHCVMFTYQSQSIAATVNDDLRIWPRTEIQESDPATLASWIRSLTGAELDELDALRPLTGGELEEHRKELAVRGGIAQTTARNLEVWRVDAVKEPQPAEWPPRVQVERQKPIELPPSPNGFPAPIVDPSA